VVISGKIFYILFPYKETKLNTLIGTYECKVDAKGRMLIPAPFKKATCRWFRRWICLEKFRFQHCLVVSYERMGENDD
jgi:MraZ protein